MNRWVLGGVVAALLAAVWVLMDEPAPLLAPKPTSQVSSATSYALLTQARSSQFNETGQLSYRYQADSMEYFREHLGRVSPSDYTLVKQPVLMFYGEGLPWTMTAQSGKIIQQGDVLELTQAVRIWQERGQGKRTLLTTEHLSVQPKAHFVHTDAAVHLEAPSGQVSAVGLTVDLTTERVKLHSKVKGQHESIQ